MVERVASAGAAALARDASRLGVGLHADVDGLTADECADALEAQLATFRGLVGRDPTHVDSHHHAHRSEDLRPVFEAFADRHGRPLRDRDLPHCGDFYGPDAIAVELLLALLARLRGPAELGCHPGYADGLESAYAAERELELATLTDPRVRARVDELGIELICWDDAA